MTWISKASSGCMVVGTSICNAVRSTPHLQCTPFYMPIAGRAVRIESFELSCVFVRSPSTSKSRPLSTSASALVWGCCGNSQQTQEANDDGTVSRARREICFGSSCTLRGSHIAEPTMRQVVSPDKYGVDRPRERFGVIGDLQGNTENQTLHD
jgi:hypothetical protein